jgi:hypothetical protein
MPAASMAVWLALTALTLDSSMTPQAWFVADDSRAKSASSRVPPSPAARSEA